MRFLRLFVVLVVAAVLPVQADVPDPDGVCDGDESANVQCEVIAGPASLTVKSVVSVGIGFCQTETTDIPLQCEGAAGDINGVGAATFGDATWTSSSRIIEINVVNEQQTCTAATSPPCGFTVHICNDRDQDSNCTNIGDQDDEIYGTAASEGALGSCKDEDKGCDDPNEAGWDSSGDCMQDSVYGNWSDEQIIVFIGVEAGPSVSPPDVQAAVSAGTYTVWMEDNGPATCVIDPALRTGCIWERGPADTLLAEARETLADANVDPLLASPVEEALPRFVGPCADDNGNPIYFACEGGDTFLIVLHVGPGSTSATNNSCSGQDPQTATATSPINVQAVTGSGYFQCQFTWYIAGAGACFVV